MIVLGTVLAVFGLSFGTTLIVSGMVEVIGGLRSKSWPKADGVVTYSKLDSRVWHGDDNRPHLERDFKLQYRYEVDGLSYTSVRYKYGLAITDASEARRLNTELYPVGAGVTVRYNPKRPQQSTLRTGCDASYMLLSVIPFAIGTYGILSALSIIPA
jgi:hypothetical protein